MKDYAMRVEIPFSFDPEVGSSEGALEAFESLDALLLITQTGDLEVQMDEEREGYSVVAEIRGERLPETFFEAIATSLQALAEFADKGAYVTCWDDGVETGFAIGPNASEVMKEHYLSKGFEVFAVISAEEAVASSKSARQTATIH